MKKMFKVVLVLALCLFFMPTSLERVYASYVNQSGECGDDATFVYDSTTRVVTISGSGAIDDQAFSNFNGTGANGFAVNDDVNKIVIEEGITEIGNYAFENVNVVEFELPNTIEVIGDYAFRGCDRLRSIVIPDSVKTIKVGAFMNCDSLEKVKLSNSMKVISKQLFQGCKKLKALEIPNSITTIEPHAFSYCESKDLELDIRCNMTIKSDGFGSILGLIGQTKFYGTINIVKEGNYKAYFESWCEEELAEEQFVLNTNLSHLYKETKENDEGILVDVCELCGYEQIHKEYVDLKLTLPDKKEYQLYEELDLTGLKVYSIDDDGNKYKIYDYTISGYDQSKIGEQVITVAYKNVEKTFKVNVSNSKLEEKKEQLEELISLVEEEQNKAIFYDEDRMNDLTNNLVEAKTVYVNERATLAELESTITNLSNAYQTFVEYDGHDLFYNYKSNNTYELLCWHCDENFGRAYLNEKDGLYYVFAYINDDIMYHYVFDEDINLIDTQQCSGAIYYEFGDEYHNTVCKCHALINEFDYHVSSGEATYLEDEYCIHCGYIINYALDFSEVFIDVEYRDWFYSSVVNAYNKGLMSNTGKGKKYFEPDAPITRGMVATVLHRMAGNPKVTYSNKFPDVKKGVWYSNAIIWAAENKVVSGNKDGNYAPDKEITRQDLAIMLRNYAASQGLNTSKVADLTPFLDDDKVASYAKSAIAWCVEAKLMSGAKTDKGSKLNPQANASRAECAKMFSLLDDLIK